MKGAAPGEGRGGRSGGGIRLVEANPRSASTNQYSRRSEGAYSLVYFVNCRE